MSIRINAVGEVIRGAQGKRGSSVRDVGVDDTSVKGSEVGAFAFVGARRAAARGDVGPY